MGQRFKRLDGPPKASGRAKYSSDLNPKDLLFAVYNTCPTRTPASPTWIPAKRSR